MAEDPEILSRRLPPDEVVTYADHVAGVADVWYAGPGGDDRPLLLIAHGGFWRPWYDRHHTGAMAAALASAGWTTASIEYRRHPGEPDLAADDVRAAVDRLPSLVGGHDSRLVLLGHSAGGHLVLLTAASGRPGLAGVVALAPVADLVLCEAMDLGSGAVTAYLGCAVVERLDLDPSRLPTPEAPVVVVHGSDDVVVPIGLSASYVVTHPATRLLAVPHAGHFELIDPDSAAWPVVIDAVRLASAPA